MFNSWDELNLMDDCKAGEHYHLLSQQNWTKLKSTFGGGPEIPFFQYQVETEVVNEDGTKEIKKESKHDFDPIRVCVHVLKRTKETAEKSLVLLVSKHLTHLQFKNYLAQVRTDVVSRVEMFVLNPTGEDMPCIMEVGKEKKTLAELGVGHYTDIVIFDCDISPDNQINKTQLYHIIAERFGVEKKDYEQLLPALGQEQDHEGPMMDFYDSMPAPRQSNISRPIVPSLPQVSSQKNNGVPAEYAHDPELYYALQASLGFEVNEGANNGYSNIDDMIRIESGMDIDEEISSTGPMANAMDIAAMEVAHNVSMDGGSTPKRGNRQVGPGPIFDESEFGPSGQGPQVHQSALVS